MSIETIVEAGYLVAHPIPDRRPVESSWLDLGSDDAIIWVTPWLGPSATITIHRLCSWFKQGAPFVHISLEDIARSAGLRFTPTNNDRFIKTIRRLALFNLISTDDNDNTKIWVKTHLSHLPQPLLDRLPSYLANSCPCARTD